MDAGELEARPTVQGLEFVLRAFSSAGGDEHVEVHPLGDRRLVARRDDPFDEQQRAVGSNGAVLRSLDDGSTWQQISIQHANELDFRDVEAFSADEAYVMSSGDGEISSTRSSTTSDFLRRSRASRTNPPADLKLKRATPNNQTSTSHGNIARERTCTG